MIIALSAITILMDKNSLCFNVLVLKQCRGAVNKEAILFSQLLKVKYILHAEKYCNPKTIQQFLKKKISVDIPSATKTRSTGINFNITSDYTFCEQPVIADDRHVDRSDGMKIITTDFDCSIRKICNERNDDWSMLVFSRLNCSIAD